MPWFSKTSAGEAGAVALLVGSRYITFGSVPEAESLEVLRIEKIPREWLVGTWGVGDTVAFPIQNRGEGKAYPLQTDWWPEEVKEAWREEGYQELRKACAGEDYGLGPNPSTEEMVEALLDDGVRPPGHIDADPKQAGISYTLLELAEGIEEAGGPAAEEALGLLEGQVTKFKRKKEVADAYLTIEEDGGEYETVQEVADAFEVSWRTVHRYVDEVLPEEQRIVQKAEG